jgi:integrase
MASVAKRVWKYKGEKRECWVVRYTDKSGKKHLKTFESKKNADSFRNKISFDLERGEHIGSSGDMKFNDVLEPFLRHCEARVAVGNDLRGQTLRTWRRLIKKSIQPKFGSYRLRDVTLREMQAWFDALVLDETRPIKRASLELRLTILRAIFRYVEKNGLYRNPLKAEKIELGGAPLDKIPVPSRDEVRQLLLMSDSRKSSPAPYLKPLIYTAIFSGLRKGELRGLIWDNVNFKDDIIQVRQSADDLGLIGKPKSKAAVRDVPIAPPLLKVLREWRLAAPISPYVFTPTRGRPPWASRVDGKAPAKPSGVLSQTAINEIWKTFQRRAFGKTRWYRFHSLRHAAAAIFIESGLPPKRIQEIMGHASIKMTFDLYGYLFEDRDLVRKSMEQIGTRWAF